MFYPVKYVGPSLHSDALEHSQHGEEEVVEVSDSSVGTVPPTPTLWAVNDALTAVTGKRTRHRVVLHVLIWKIIRFDQNMPRTSLNDDEIWLKKAVFRSGDKEAYDTATLKCGIKQKLVSNTNSTKDMWQVIQNRNLKFYFVHFCNFLKCFLYCVFKKMSSLLVH